MAFNMALINLSNTLSEGESIRSDCPCCSGKNTFTMTRLGAIVLYNCYRASCGYSGKKKQQFTKTGIIQEFTSTSSKIDKVFILPPYLIYPANNIQCGKWINKYELWDCMAKSRALIKYDTRLNRLVFCIRNRKNEILGAIGRALSLVNSPKWLRYDTRNDLYFFVRNAVSPQIRSKNLLVVEDCISACVASGVLDSVAMLGTNPSVLLRDADFLRRYERIFLAFDPDAMSKAFDTEKQFALLRPTKIIQLRKDVKDTERLDLMLALKDGHNGSTAQHYRWV